VSEFKTEAELCVAFTAWVARRRPDLKCYAECDGWDLLIVYPDGTQLGIQAKLRLNAEVIMQAVPSDWHGEHGPEFRAVLVPEERGAFIGLARHCGLIVFAGRSVGRRSWRGDEFCPDLTPHNPYGLPWIDWCPETRSTVPEFATDSIAGSPSPITLTQWKTGALRVLAELEVAGKITRQKMRALRVDERRWIQMGWLKSTEPRGTYVIDKRPPFADQHPTAYAAILAERRATEVRAPVPEGANA
jgi:hypothetical protein